MPTPILGLAEPVADKSLLSLAEPDKAKPNLLNLARPARVRRVKRDDDGNIVDAEDGVEVPDFESYMAQEKKPTNWGKTIKSAASGLWEGLVKPGAIGVGKLAIGTSPVGQVRSLMEMAEKPLDATTSQKEATGLVEGGARAVRGWYDIGKTALPAIADKITRGIDMARGFDYDQAAKFEREREYSRFLDRALTQQEREKAPNILSNVGIKPENIDQDTAVVGEIVLDPTNLISGGVPVSKAIRGIATPLSKIPLVKSAGSKIARAIESPTASVLEAVSAPAKQIGRLAEKVEPAADKLAKMPLGTAATTALGTYEGYEQGGVPGAITGAVVGSAAIPLLSKIPKVANQLSETLIPLAETAEGAAKAIRGGTGRIAGFGTAANEAVSPTAREALAVAGGALPAEEATRRARALGFAARGIRPAAPIIDSVLHGAGIGAAFGAAESGGDPEGLVAGALQGMGFGLMGSGAGALLNSINKARLGFSPLEVSNYVRQQVGRLPETERQEILIRLQNDPTKFETIVPNLEFIEMARGVGGENVDVQLLSDEAYRSAVAKMYGWEPNDPRLQTQGVTIEQAGGRPQVLVNLDRGDATAHELLHAQEQLLNLVDPTGKIKAAGGLRDAYTAFRSGLTERFSDADLVRHFNEYNRRLNGPQWQDVQAITEPEKALIQRELAADANDRFNMLATALYGIGPDSRRQLARWAASTPIDKIADTITMAYTARKPGMRMPDESVLFTDSVGDTLRSNARELKNLGNLWVEQGKVLDRLSPGREELEGGTRIVTRSDMAEELSRSLTNYAEALKNGSHDELLRAEQPLNEVIATGVFATRPKDAGTVYKEAQIRARLKHGRDQVTQAEVDAERAAVNPVELVNKKNFPLKPGEEPRLASQKERKQAAENQFSALSAALTPVTKQFATREEALKNSRGELVSYPTADGTMVFEGPHLSEAQLDAVMTIPDIVFPAANKVNLEALNGEAMTGSPRPIEMTYYGAVKNSGNIPRSRRAIHPNGFYLSKAENFVAKSFDRSSMARDVEREGAKPAGTSVYLEPFRKPSEPTYAEALDRFHEAFNRINANHAAGVPGAVGLDPDARRATELRDAVNGLLGVAPAEINPLASGNNYFKSFRVDRAYNLRAGDELTGKPDYIRAKANFMPEGKSNKEIRKEFYASRPDRDLFQKWLAENSGEIHMNRPWDEKKFGPRPEIGETRYWFGEDVTVVGRSPISNKSDPFLIVERQGGEDGRPFLQDIAARTLKLDPEESAEMGDQLGSIFGAYTLTREIFSGEGISREQSRSRTRKFNALVEKDPAKAKEFAKKYGNAKSDSLIDQAIIRQRGLSEGQFMPEAERREPAPAKYVGDMDFTDVGEGKIPLFNLTRDVEAPPGFPAGVEGSTVSPDFLKAAGFDRPEGYSGDFMPKAKLSSQIEGREGVYRKYKKMASKGLIPTPESLKKWADENMKSGDFDPKPEMDRLAQERYGVDDSWDLSEKKLIALEKEVTENFDNLHDDFVGSKSDEAWLSPTGEFVSMSDFGHNTHNHLANLPYGSGDASGMTPEAVLIEKGLGHVYAPMYLNGWRRVISNPKFNKELFTEGWGKMTAAQEKAVNSAAERRGFKAVNKEASKTSDWFTKDDHDWAIDSLEEETPRDKKDWEQFIKGKVESSLEKPPTKIERARAIQDPYTDTTPLFMPESDKKVPEIRSEIAHYLDGPRKEYFYIEPNGERSLSFKSEAQAKEDLARRFPELVGRPGNKRPMLGFINNDFEVSMVPVTSDNTTHESRGLSGDGEAWRLGKDGTIYWWLKKPSEDLQSELVSKLKDKGLIVNGRQEVIVPSVSHRFQKNKDQVYPHSIAHGADFMPKGENKGLKKLLSRIPKNSMTGKGGSVWLSPDGVAYDSMMDHGDIFEGLGEDAPVNDQARSLLYDNGFARVVLNGPDIMVEGSKSEFTRKQNSALRDAAIERGGNVIYDDGTGPEKFFLFMPSTKAVVDKVRSQLQQKAPQALSELDSLLSQLNLPESPTLYQQALDSFDKPQQLRNEGGARGVKDATNLFTNQNEEDIKPLQKLYADNVWRLNLLSRERYDEQLTTTGLMPTLDFTPATTEYLGIPAPDPELAVKQPSRLLGKLEETRMTNNLVPEGRTLSELGLPNDQLTVEQLPALDAYFGDGNWVLKRGDNVGAGEGVWFGDKLKADPLILEQVNALPRRVRSKLFLQRTYDVAGATPAERAQGKTIVPGETRVHVTADQEGNAKVIPYASWVKGEWTPRAIRTPELIQAEESALAAVNALPKDQRPGAMFGVDVVPLKQGGYGVVELNPTQLYSVGDKVGAQSSGYLIDSALVQDAYIAGLQGKLPIHAKLARLLLAIRGKELARAAGEQAPRAYRRTQLEAPLTLDETPSALIPMAEVETASAPLEVPL